jgi:hypothetical protein
MSILYTIIFDSHLDDSLVYSEYRFTIAVQFKIDVINQITMPGTMPAEKSRTILFDI